MTQKLDQHAKEMRSKVFRHMLETRSWKYKAFLRYLKFFKYFAFAPIRGEFLESYYVLMRYIDDIVDGDVKLPSEYADEETYMIEKIRFSQHPESPKDEVDYLMLYCFELANQFGQDFQAETNDILNSLLFDAKRRGKLIAFPNDQLMQHFHVLDIRGTIRATLKIFKEDPEKYHFLQPLGVACRYQYDLEDFETDIEAGYVNISQEDMETFGLQTSDLFDRSSPKVRNWKRHRAQEGLKLLDEHHRQLPKANFSLSTRATFPFVYEFPARKLFKRILAQPLEYQPQKTASNEPV